MAKKDFLGIPRADYLLVEGLGLQTSNVVRVSMSEEMEFRGLLERPEIIDTNVRIFDDERVVWRSRRH